MQVIGGHTVFGGNLFEGSV